MKLLIDIGNSRLKWALTSGTTLQRTGAIVHDGAPARALAELPRERVDAVWIAQVTGTQTESDLAIAVRTRYGMAPHFARSRARWHELRNAYREPERLGVDRWLAMIAAWSACRGAACVVDAGTALTVDVIAADGRHLGGLIAAGLQTQQQAVLGATRFATRTLEADYGGGLGDDTESCVRQGAMLACLGAIERSAALAGGGASRWLTGGDAATLAPHLDAGWQYHAFLVLEGLAALAAEGP